MNPLLPMEFAKLAAQYQEALFRTILPFWTSHSRDTLCGGYFNSLTEQGEVFDTDKYIHLQAQQVWAFARLYTEVDAQSGWLELAQHGADFLLRYGRGPNGRWLAAVDRRGRPVTLSDSVIPDCLAAMAFSRLHQATGDEEAAVVAQDSLRRAFTDRQEQRQQWENQLGGFRRFKHISEPMFLLKAFLESKPYHDPDWYKEAFQVTLDELTSDFFDKRLNLLMENVLPEGAFCDNTLGRRIQAGYAFETAEYLLEAAESVNNRRLAQQAVLMSLHIAEISWDNPSGGFLQYADLKERPLVFSEWDRKLGWVHGQALSTMIRGYLKTRHPDCLKWFKRIHEYAWQHFPDKAHKEWFGVLDRKGQPVTPLKATPEKGCYHLIKSLHDTWRTLEQCAQLRPVVGSVLR